MKKNRILISILFVCLLILLTSCSDNSSSSTSSTSATKTSTDAMTVDYDDDDYYFDWQSQDYTTINLDDGSSTITKSGIYEITGTLDDGSLIVYVDKSADDGTIYLVLNGASISSSNSAPIYIYDAQKVVIILENGTQNTIYQGSSVKTDDSGNPSAAIFSKADLTITGGGTLMVTSEFNDCITSKDNFKMTDGTLNINAAGDGIVGKDLLAIKDGNITITAGKDGMRSTNDTDDNTGNVVIEGGTFNITADGDGIQAYDLLQIDGGTYNITTGGGYTSSNTNTGNFGGKQQETTASANDTVSMKALKGSQSLIINDGTFIISSANDAMHFNGDITITGGSLTIQANDDAIHSDTDIKVTGGTINIKNCNEGIEAANVTVDSGSIDITSSDDGFNINDSSGLLTINDGEIYINAGGDGLDSNNSVKITGGTVHVDGPTDNGNGAIDYNSTFEITGGTLIAAGSSGMAEVAESGSQSSLLMYFSSEQAAGTTITLKDNNGNVIVTYTPTKQYASVAISSPKLAAGSTYTLYTGNTKVVTFELTDNVTYLNESGVTTKQSIGGGGNISGSGGGSMGGGPGGSGR